MLRNRQIFSSVASIIALAAGATLANATVTTAVGTSIYGIEYATTQAADTVQTLVADNATSAPTFQSSLAGGLLVGDVITVTLGGDAGARFSTAVADTATLTCATGGAMSAATRSLTGTTIVFTATLACPANDVITLAGADLLNSSLGTAGTVNLSYSISRAATVVSATAAPVTVATVAREYDAAVTGPFNGVVSHKNNNKVFQNAAGNIVSNDVLRIALTNRNIVDATDSEGTANAVVVNLAGNWSILDDAGDGCTDADLGAGESRLTVTTPAGAPSVEFVDCNNIRITLNNAAAAFTTAGTGGNLDIDLITDQAADGMTTVSAGSLVPGTITATVTLNYNTDNNVGVFSRSPTVTAGSFTSGASTVFVPYMPAGSNISQILYITNNSAAAGSVTVTGRDQNGVACSAANMGGTITVGANRVVNLSGAIAAGLANCWGGASVTNKLALTIQTNLPDETVEVYSAYNVGGSDRATVLNSSNGRSPVANGMGAGNSTSRE